MRIGVDISARRVGAIGAQQFFPALQFDLPLEGRPEIEQTKMVLEACYEAGFEHIHSLRWWKEDG